MLPHLINPAGTASEGQTFLGTPSSCLLPFPTHPAPSKAHPKLVLPSTNPEFHSLRKNPQTQDASSCLITAQKVAPLGGNETKAAIKTRVFMEMVLMIKIKWKTTENDALKPWDLSGIFPQCYFSQNHCHLFKMSHESFIHKHTLEAPQTPDRQLRHVRILPVLISQHVKYPDPAKAVPGNSRPFPAPGNGTLQG